MEKIKWHYDKKFKQWYVMETSAYAKDGVCIRKKGTLYILEIDDNIFSWYFKKLSSAKQVANLLRHG